jgi:hypothetical protein
MIRRRLRVLPAESQPALERAAAGLVRGHGAGWDHPHDLAVQVLEHQIVAGLAIAIARLAIDGHLDAPVGAALQVIVVVGIPGVQRAILVQRDRVAA